MNELTGSDFLYQRSVMSDVDWQQLKSTEKYKNNEITKLNLERLGKELSKINKNSKKLLLL